MKRLLLLGGALGCLVGCGGGGRNVATVCAQDSDCASGLVCAQTYNSTFTGADGGCSKTASAKVCTKACAATTECAALAKPSGAPANDVVKCLLTCNESPGLCLLTPGP